MIIAIIHERCTIEESEPAFNQFVTLEQNQSKKKKIITKKHLILIKSLHPSNSSKTTNEPKSLALDFHLDLREKDRSRALLWPEKDGQRKISLSKGSQITKITLRHRRIVVVYSRLLAIMQFYLFSDPLYRLVVRFDDDGAREERSAFPSCTAAATQIPRSER